MVAGAAGSRGFGVPGMLGPRVCPGPSYTREFGTLCCAIVLPGPNSGFRARFRPDSSPEKLEIGLPAGRRPAGGPRDALGGTPRVPGRPPGLERITSPGRSLATLRGRIGDRRFWASFRLNLAPRGAAQSPSLGTDVRPAKQGRDHCGSGCIAVRLKTPARFGRPWEGLPGLCAL